MDKCYIKFWDVFRKIDLQKDFVFLWIVLILFHFSCSENDNFVEQEDLWMDRTQLQNNDWKMAEEMISLINDYRSSIAKKELVFDRETATILAIEHCNYMIENNEVTHNNFPGRNRVLLQLGALRSGENIAFGYYTSKAAVLSWIRSPGHKSIMEGDFNHLGVGVVKSSENRNYITAIFYFKE